MALTSTQKVSSRYSGDCTNYMQITNEIGVVKQFSEFKFK